MRAGARGRVLDALTGAALVMLGAYHAFSGGAQLARWLVTAQPALAPVAHTEVQIGFALGGYLAIALGLQQVLFGARTASAQHGFWAAVYIALAALSFWHFRALHASQGLLMVSALLLWRARLTALAGPGDGA